ncbi:hypothetical protein JCM30566_19830 [Marinitoga arctica]|uniref:Chemotaxis methyl-accepting receptor HlyB-like 4HB MCP domain-containing protein n=1 Tax=Marinitoga hydrogenitolerans (strain DSM 16785 / JCM 12826 / AT1271) TaxID=1122195 RepID=A0A1M4WP64_MARH1|nr:hypothetical protein [Marinitoga hydrogenitolerans]SHE82762.1 hypothetical protein SAMN02745164_01216 [Marinitoga hydrogenitolerans DSM 16785]
MNLINKIIKINLAIVLSIISVVLIFQVISIFSIAGGEEISLSENKIIKDIVDNYMKIEFYIKKAKKGEIIDIEKINSLLNEIENYKIKLKRDIQKNFQEDISSAE